MALPFLYLAIYCVAVILFFFVAGCIILVALTEPYPVIWRSVREKHFQSGVGDSKISFPSIDDKWAVTLSVVIPAYNEETRLPVMLDECLEFLENRKKESKKFTYEVLIVSDGSYDKTVEVALRYTKKYGSDQVRVLELNPNRGKGGAVQLGVLSARGAMILFADADGATKFADITKLEARLSSITKLDSISEAGGCSEEMAVVCGSRAHLEEESIATRSFFRTLLMQGFHFLVWLLAVRSVRDTQCGFKLFTRSAASALFHSLHVQRWAFDVELLYIAEVLNIPIEEEAVRWTEIDGSKIIPVLSWLQMGKDLFFIWLRYRLGAWKIHSRTE